MSHSSSRTLDRLLARKLSQVPQLDRLVLAVRDDVPAVTAGVDVGDSVYVTGEHAHGFWATLSQRPPVPNPAKAIVSSAGQDVRRSIDECNSINVIFVSVNPERLSLSKTIEKVNITVVGPAQDLIPVRAEPQRKDAEPRLVRGG